ARSRSHRPVVDQDASGRLGRPLLTVLAVLGGAIRRPRPPEWLGLGAGGVELGDERAHANAFADCSVSSEPRKNTILPSAKRHQCCMYMHAELPVVRTL